MYQLIVIAGPDKGKSFTLNTGPNLSLGRGKQAHYQVTDPRVSRQHCDILFQGERVMVTCLDGVIGFILG
jgi:pSer/pThr/pTyr-binding forkhead associated (FHA) protein